jgi:hypothetical protein
MHNPLRSEADAFRWIVVVGIGAASVILLTLLTRPAVGVAWAAALVGFGAGLGLRGIGRGPGDGLSVSRGEDGRRRILVLADESVAKAALVAELVDRSGSGSSEVFLVVPGPDPSERSSQPEAAELARQRLELSLQAIQEAGLRARGRLGDSDHGAALTEALREFGADEIVIVDRG